MASDPPTESIHHKTSSSDLFSSAKVLFGAAQSAVSHDGAAFDKSKVAEAGEDVLDAAVDYGKLKEKGYGSYIDKAEGYLHQLHSSDPKSAHSDQKPANEEKSTDPVKESTPEEPKPSGGFGGFGGFINKAEGFLK